MNHDAQFFPRLPSQDSHTATALHRTNRLTGTLTCGDDLAATRATGMEGRSLPQRRHRSAEGTRMSLLDQVSSDHLSSNPGYPSRWQTTTYLVHTRRRPFGIRNVAPAEPQCLNRFPTASSFGRFVSAPSRGKAATGFLVKAETSCALCSHVTHHLLRSRRVADLLQNTDGSPLFAANWRSVNN
jgi:hypothetical protein